MDKNKKGCLAVAGYIVLLAFVLFLGIFDEIDYDIKNLRIFDEIKNEAYTEGLDAGKKIGEETGYETGYDAGYETGFDAGYDEGVYDGKIEKSNELAVSGKTYDAGYRKGYAAGKEAEKENKKADIVFSGSQTNSYQEPQENIYDYVLNKNTDKFHYKWCSAVNDIKGSNKIYFSGTREEVINKGYAPCQQCYP